MLPSPVSWAKPPIFAPLFSARIALALSEPKLIAEMLKIDAVIGLPAIVAADAGPGSVAGSATGAARSSRR